MTKIDFNNRSFSLIENSEKGKVNTDTIFEFKQNGEIVTATYYGGMIKYGKIIAVLKNEKLDMLYQCITTDNELKSGKAMADITFTESQKLKLKLHWEWLNNKNETGISEYIEN